MNSQQSANIHSHKILILDFGSQYTQLIARRIREIGVYCEIYSCECTSEEVEAFAPKGIILSGGPESVTSGDTPRAPQVVFELGVPVLGICYGMQTMTEQMGGKVESSDHREFGYAQIRARGHSKLLSEIEDHVSEEGYGLLDVWMSHGDRVVDLPEGFNLIASSEGAPIAGIANEEKSFYGVQFHPEVTHTKQGGRILERFVIDICACDALWTSSNIIEDNIQSVRESVGTDTVILGLSGGVDSSVVAALLHKAIGKQLICVFVDTGLLRLNEGDQVMAMFAEHMGVNVIRVDAEQRYLDKLAGVTDPEAKRKIIGNLFIEIFDEEAAKLTDAKWLAQGTIYPDVIESAGSKSGKAHLIKSHH
ncbi:MAG: glutamine-hydrolyzing GMP synthase, partial [Methylomarinum sp.]|nr:glutamine-hydrolyzing GMP synthase [Methylomarinum sp.]